MMKFSRKLTFTLISFSAFATLLLVLSRGGPIPEPPTSGRNMTYCVRLRNVPSLPRISAAQVPKNGAIFFHEASCASYERGKIGILARQACSVESAARAHPRTPVYLLYSSPGELLLGRDREGRAEATESDDFLRALLSYRNVRVHHLDYENYFRGGIAESLLRNGTLEGSRYAVAHASDVLRFTTMYKYGGIYLDLDVIVVKSLLDLAPNFSGVDTNITLAVGVMRFTADGVGHEVAEMCLKDVKEHFNGEIWGQNGPLLLERVMLKRCPEAKTVMGLTQMADCKGFKIYPRQHFYKMNWYQRDWLFDPSKMADFRRAINESETIHLWNRDTAAIKAPVNSSMPIVQLAKEFCPRVFRAVREFF